MNSSTLSPNAVAPETTRYDIYFGIHKAQRSLMVDTLLSLGRMDTDDEQELGHVSRRVLEMLDFYTRHILHKSKFIHAAIEAREPDASTMVAQRHEVQDEHITRLRFLICVLQKTTTQQLATAALKQQRASVALDLYRHLALFIGDSFRHMHLEEATHSAVL